VKTKPGRGGGTFSYITARTVMNRLDQAVGPENWRDDFRELSSGNVMCTIFVRVDGEWIGKSDIGTESDVEEDKGAFSDAFKRAGVKWGIARELYKEGTAYDDPMPPRPAASAPRTPPAQKPAPKAEKVLIEAYEPESNVDGLVPAMERLQNFVVSNHEKVATPAPQTREERRIGAEVDRTKRRNLKTAEIAELKEYVISISQKVQSEPRSRWDFHAAGSIRKALGIENWAQCTIALDNEVEELAAIRAHVQKYVETEHVAPDNSTEPDSVLGKAA
jgi:hypothetical protein